jgi:hypothetical protein
VSRRERHEREEREDVRARARALVAVGVITIFLPLGLSSPVTTEVTSCPSETSLERQVADISGVPINIIFIFKLPPSRFFCSLT